MTQPKTRFFPVGRYAPLYAVDDYHQPVGRALGCAEIDFPETVHALVDTTMAQGYAAPLNYDRAASRVREDD